MKEKINKNVKQILLGSLLGDGSVYQRSKNTAYYSEVHSIKQKEYLLWKNANCFEKFCTKIRMYKSYEKTQQKYYEKIGLYSKASSLLLFYRKLFYPKEKKAVGIEILNQIDKLGLAMWYCDDGSCHLTKKTVRIMTDAFSYTEQKLIQKWFKEKWNLQCKIIKRKTGSFYVGFDTKESEKFLNLIRNYLPVSMSYKLGHLWEGNKERIENAMKKESIKKHEYYLKNKEKILTHQKEYQRNPKIKKRERLKKHEYYIKNREKIIERCRVYQKNNRKKIKKQKQIYYSKNMNKIKKRQKKYYFQNRENILRKQIEYNKRCSLSTKRGV